VSPEDADENSDNREDREAMWEQLGRELLYGELAEIRYEIEEVFRDAEDAINRGGQDDGSDDLTPEHITALRRALNRARDCVENEVAPVAGVDPWSHPLPEIPNGVLWEMSDHPMADDVDPRDYVDEECEGREGSK